MSHGFKHLKRRRTPSNASQIKHNKLFFVFINVPFCKEGFGISCLYAFSML